jgi:hypothetical protein
MATWKVTISSAGAQGVVVVEAASRLAAKDSAYNQFLRIEKSNIIWDSEPSHWVACKKIELIECQESTDET